MKQTTLKMRLLKYFQCQISLWVGWLSERRGGWLTRIAIRDFIRRYRVDMHEVERENYRDYSTFNDFFTRRLKANARPIDGEPGAIVSPVDGSVSQAGHIQDDLLLQVKGKYYSLRALLGGDEDLSASFRDGSFLTAYLAPKDYHRIHMPCEGRLLKTIYVPGHLFPVNPSAVATVDQLFSRNERLVCVFETPDSLMVLVLVGALLVGNICMTWEGEATTSRCSGHFQVQDYSADSLFFQRGEGIGYFTMGSTVITLFPKGAVEWNSNCHENQPLFMGQRIGEVALVRT